MDVYACSACSLCKVQTSIHLQVRYPTYSLSIFRTPLPVLMSLSLVKANNMERALVIFRWVVDKSLALLRFWYRTTRCGWVLSFYRDVRRNSLLRSIFQVESLNHYWRNRLKRSQDQDDLWLWCSSPDALPASLYFIQALIEFPPLLIVKELWKRRINEIKDSSVNCSPFHFWCQQNILFDEFESFAWVQYLLRKYFLCCVFVSFHSKIMIARFYISLF